LRLPFYTSQYESGAAKVQTHRPAHGRGHGVPARRAPPRDVIGRAVVDGGADERQSQRDVDRLTEAEQLDRGQSLIVKEREDQTELARGGAMEYGIRGYRPLDLDAGVKRARAVDRRLDDRAILGPEQSVLARVRVDRRDRDAPAQQPPARKLRE